MNNAFDGIISRLDMDEERINEVEDMPIKTSKTSKWREEKKWKKKNRICDNRGTITESIPNM